MMKKTDVGAFPLIGVRQHSATPLPTPVPRPRAHSLLLAAGLVLAAGWVVGAGAQEKAGGAEKAEPTRSRIMTPENWAISKVSAGAESAVAGVGR